VLVRQQQRDVGLLMHLTRDLSERQSQIFVLIMSFLARYEPPELQPVIDDDVAQAMAALASTYETASRGLIYEHRPASLPAERLMLALKPALAEAGRGAGTVFERDAAVVLRRMQEAASEAHSRDVQNRRALLDVLKRIVTTTATTDTPTDPAMNDETPPRLIVP
jgi:hypothetical protein